MDGIEYYFYLRYILKSGQDLSDAREYTFDGWDKEGKLRYSVNNSLNKQIKTIESELIVFSKHWEKKKITINYKFVKENGHDNYCTPTVLNWLLGKYHKP